MEKLFDLFLRTGFRQSDPSAAGGWHSGLEAVSGIEEYSLDSDFSDVLSAARQGDAPYVLFADDATRVAPDGVKTLLRVLRRNRSVPAATLASEALVRVFGLPPQELRTDVVKQSMIPLGGQVPSWFAVINRRVLERLSSPGERYSTLEFFLFELAHRLRERGLASYCLTQWLGLDVRYWMLDLLERAASALGTDFARYSAVHNGDSQIPPQFKIQVVGDFDRAPDPRLEAGEAAALAPPLITVICPVYKADFFAEMVESVLAQTYENWELRLLVDGPPESHRWRILEVLERHWDNPRLFWTEQENRGTGPTRRALGQMAAGEYILSIDDDDMLAPEALEVFAAAIRRYPEVEFFRGGARMVGLVDRYHPPRPRVLVDGISADLFEVTQPFLIRRDTLERLNGFEGDDSIKGAGEDTDLFLKVDRERIRTVIIDRPLYLRRLSLSNQCLSFELPSALGHLDTLDKRFTPSRWAIVDRLIAEDGLYSISVLTYANQRDGSQVVCPTRYFSYQTVGDTRDRSVDLEITSVCNAVCSFCPREVLGGKNQHMPLETVRRIAEHRLSEGGERRIVLCGIGEPTLHPHLEEIVRILAEVSSEVCMTSNGTLLNGKRFETLAECGVREFNFSLNSVTPETHRAVMSLKNFEEVHENLDEILDTRRALHPQVSVHVSFVLCNLNQHEAVDFVEKWRHRNVDNVWVHPVNNRAGQLSPGVQPVPIEALEARYAGDPKVIVALFPHAQERGRICKIARDIDFISVDGAMRLCAMDYRRATFYGSVDQMTIQDMHLNKMLSYIRGETRELCTGCEFCPSSGSLPIAS